MNIRALLAIAAMSAPLAGASPAHAGHKSDKDRKAQQSRIEELRKQLDESRGHRSFGFSDKKWDKSSWEKDQSERREREAQRIKQLPFKAKLDDKQRAGIEKMLSGPNRPSLEEFAKVMKATYGDRLPEENPFGDAAYVRFSEKTVANMIAQVEHAYPGGNYFALGRDAVLVADTMHAFYSSIGQPDRVKRLDMSGKSLPHYRDSNERTYGEDRQVIYDYLVSNGLDLKNAEKKPPFVMIDITGYSPSSQSTQLMRSTYRTAAMQGLDLKKLSNRVAFIGIGGGPGPAISDVDDIDHVKQHIANGVTSEGPRNILYLHRDISSLTYKGEGFWHDDFLKYEKDAKGNTFSRPGEMEKESRRIGAMAELFEVMKLAQSPTLLKQVQSIAKEKYGYEFPMQRTEQLKRDAKRMVIRSVVDHGGGSSGGIGETFIRTMSASLKHDPSIDNARLFLTDLAGMWSRKSIAPEAVDEAIAEMLKRVPALKSTDEGFEMRQKIYRENPGFGDVFFRVLKKTF